MFINFSNHPSKLWAEDERNAALQYGTIEDLAFVPGRILFKLACDCPPERSGSSGGSSLQRADS